MRQNIAAIITTEIIGNTQAKATIEETLADCIKASKDHWIAPTEDERLQAAVSAALLLTESQEDKKRLMKSYALLNELSVALKAAQAGISVDFEKIIDGNQGFGDVVPIMDLWHKNK